MVSKSNTKYIQSLHLKKFRDIEGCFIAEGSKVVLELLQSTKLVCRHVYGLEEWLHEQEQNIRRFYGGPIEPVLPHELEKISALQTPNQVLAVFAKAAVEPVQPAGKITLLLDNIQDPGNMGTIIRNADWFGIEHIVCSEHCADIYNPKVVQSTMGSLGRVNVLYNELQRFIQQHKAIKTFAAALNGKPVNNMKGLKEGMLIIGNESKGISEALLDAADEKITIPRRGHAESLNAAVATGIILSHIME